MRAEVKAGLIVGVIAIAVGLIWWFRQPANQLQELQLDKASLDAAAQQDVGLANDAAAAKRRTPPATPPGHRQPALQQPRRRPAQTVTPAVPEAHREQAPVENPPAIRQTPLTEKPTEPAGPATEPPAHAATPPATESPSIVTPPATRTETPRGDATPPRVSEPVSPARAEHAQPAPAQPLPLQSPPAHPVGKMYTIQLGDRLIDIAEAEYGDGTLWKSIKAANPQIDENRLRIGQTITLPPLAEARRLTEQATQRPTSAQPPAGPAPAVAPRPGGTQAGRATYIVGPGDTLSKIARNVLKNETRWEEIYTLNRYQLDSPDLLYVGMELKLPPLEARSPSSQSRGG